MKTLINKHNPSIRITAPEIDVHEKDQMYFIPVVEGYYCIPLCINDWTLVEEEPEKIYYKMLDNKANCPFDKGNCNYCTVQFCGAREENHIETRSTAEPVDLEKVAEEYADMHGFRVPYDGSDKYYDGVDVKASLEGFKAGAKWMAEQRKGGGE